MFLFGDKENDGFFIFMNITSLPNLVLPIILANDDNFGFVWLFIIAELAIAAIIGIVRYANKTTRQTYSIKDGKSKFPQFFEDIVIEGEDTNHFYFATDNTRTLFLYIFEDTNILFRYDDVISTNISVDDSIIENKQSSLGVIGRAAVGGILAGGVGAIIGGGSASSTSIKKVSSVKVHIILRNHDEIPFFDVECLNSSIEVETSSDKYKWAIKKAQKIHSLLRIAIDRHDQESLTNEGSATLINVSAIAELEKLSNLLDKGVIDQDEFNGLKNKVLNKAQQE